MNLELLEKHFKEGKYDEARLLMEAFLAQPLSGKEKAGGTVEVLSLYMKLINSVNSEYVARLEEISNRLHDADSNEKETMNEIDLSRVRSMLAQGR